MNMPYPLEPYNPYSKNPRKKTLQDLIEEEHILFNLIKEQQTQTIQTINTTHQIGAGGIPPVEYYNPQLQYTSFFYYPPNPIGKATTYFVNKSSQNYQTQLKWNFGDGTILYNVDQPSHIYNTTGSFVVSVETTNAFNQSKSFSQSINVVLPTVAASFIPNITGGIAPLSISFFNNSNTDGSGTLSYKWMFDNNITSSEINPLHVFPTGSFNVSLEVTESSFGISNKFTQSIQTTPPTLSSSFSSDLSGSFSLTLPVHFTSNVFYNGSGNLTYEWLFGDGNSSSLANPIYQYSSSGIFDVQLQVTESSYNITSSQTINSYVSPYLDLAKTILESVTNMVSGLTPSTLSYNLYSSTNDVSESYQRNTNLWASTVDWSCIPVNNSSNSSLFNGILVAPDILIQANHTPTAGIIYFVDANNNVYSSSVSGNMNVAGTDIRVTKLSTPISSNVKYAKTLPSSSFMGTNVNILLSQINDKIIPSAFTNQFRTLKIGFVNELQPSASVINTNGTLSPWYSAVVGGDSGSPFFLIIDNQPVVLGVWYESDLLSFSLGPSISYYADQINPIMTLLGSSYQLTTIDLSNYHVYSV